MDYIKDPQKRLILQLEELILCESVDFYKRKGLHWLSAPVTTGAISSPMGLGSDSLPVQINLDGHQTYLADSMQFLLEYGCRFFDTGCWYIMPTFRGEDIDKRHLKQFFHSEAEIVGGLNDIMKLVEQYLKHLVSKIQPLIEDDGHLERFVENEIPRVTFDEAEQILRGTGISYQDGFRTLSNEGEQKLIEHFDGAVWVTYYDYQAAPFYQKDQRKKAFNADLLMGIGETVGCGERWTTGEEVLESLNRHHVLPDKYDWYIEMKNNFPLQTSGFGLGIERFLLFILKQNDIREMQIFRRFNDGKDIV